MEEHRLTPWQAFKDLLGASKEKSLVLSVYNPFALKPADFVVVDDVINGISKTHYQVTELDVYRRTVENQTFEFVDYILHGPEDRWLTLRVSENAGLPGTTERTLLLLFPDYEGEYDENLHKNVLPTGVLEVKNDAGELIATYERVHGLKDPYRADVLVIGADETPQHESCEYWDFGRTVDGREEFYFVEMNTETGVIRTWRAVQTSQNELSFLRRTAS
jgi:hypothetical protein